MVNAGTGEAEVTLSGIECIYQLSWLGYLWKEKWWLPGQCQCTLLLYCPVNPW